MLDIGSVNILNTKRYDLIGDLRVCLDKYSLPLRIGGITYGTTSGDVRRLVFWGIGDSFHRGERWV